MTHYLRKAGVDPMPDRTDEPRNPIKWHVRVVVVLVIATLVVALILA